MLNTETLNLIVLPRKVMTREEFLTDTPPYSMALDGIVSGGPFYDEPSKHVNFDHHDGVVREVTMSTGKQVLMAIKGGLFDAFRKNGRPHAQIFVNDPDQDTAIAVWLLDNHKLFEGTRTIPSINRLLDISDKWDMTGGAYPLDLNDRILRQILWVFQPYTDLRKNGMVAKADSAVMLNILEATMQRINKLMMGEAEEKSLDTRHEILYDSPLFKIIDEIGGNDARYYLFSQGLRAFISIIARRDDGRMVCTIGRRSRFIPFPILDLYQDFNAAEGLTTKNGWSGSDIIGGSSREFGTGLSVNDLIEITNRRLITNGLRQAA